MALPERMKFGIFLGPFHRVGENPTLAMDRDMELVQWLDYLGYEPVHIDDIIRTSGLNISTVSSVLAMMELRGLVRQVGGMNYIRA